MHVQALGCALFIAVAGCGSDVLPNAQGPVCADYVDTWAGPAETVSISQDRSNFLIEVTDSSGVADGMYVATCSTDTLTGLPSTLGDIALIRGGAAIAWAGKELTRGPEGSPTAGQAAFRIRPVITGPEPAVTPAGATPPSGESAAPAGPVTQEQAMSQYATLACGSGVTPADRSSDYLAACSSDDQVKYLLGPAIVEGTDITDATPSVQETTGEWVVLLDFDAEAQATWADYTAAHIGEAVAFTLHGQVITAPTINGAVTGPTTITGDFSEESATHLAEQLGG